MARRGDFLFADMSQQLLGPTGSLSEQFNGRRLQARVHRRKLREDDVRDLRVLQPTDREQDLRFEI